MKKTPTDIHWLKIDAQPVKVDENGHAAPSEFPYRMTTDSLDCSQKGSAYSLESRKAAVSISFILFPTSSACNFLSLRGDSGELCAKMGGKVHRFPSIFCGGSIGRSGCLHRGPPLSSCSGKIR